LLIDPAMLIEHWQPVLVITVAVVLGKVLTCSVGAFLGGNDTRTSLRVGMGLAQIGEFSFIIASLGVSLGVTSEFLYPIAVAVSAITTLLTPYLIRGADQAVAWFDAAAPAPLANTLSLYTSWVGRLGQRQPSMATKLIRKWAAQMALNAALITAVFAVAAYLGQRPPALIRDLDLHGDWHKALIWLTAAVLSLPMFIATVRKLQALGLLMAELKVTSANAGARAPAIRAVVAQVIPIAGTVTLAMYVIVLSSALLPTVKLMIVLLLIAAAISWLLRRSFIRVYSKAQFALQDTFAQPPAPRPEEPPPALKLVLREAALEPVGIAKDSPAGGRLIRELELRTRTGASIVAIERQGASIINPGADEELQAGDQVLLLGKPDQLQSARRCLQGDGSLNEDG
jgi:CPA2 family monovalent cation:H+ antiporter-2